MVKDKMERHKLTDVDKSGFPINKEGAHVSILDKDGNCFLIINNYLLEKYPEGLAVKFNPKKSLEVNQALDTLVNIITKDFDKHISGEFSIDLTEEVKQERNVYTEKPLIIPTVQTYFARIENWLNYLGNCYDVNFKVRFYVKFKNRIMQYLIPLETNLNNHEIKKSYLKYCKIWIKNMDAAIRIEQEAKNNSPKESDFNDTEKIDKEQDNENKTTPFDFNNEFDNVTPLEIIKFFSVNLLNKGYLNEQQLKKFFISAFQEQKPLKEKLTFKKSPLKTTITTIFYTYYREIASKPQGKKDNYAGLLGNYFRGYTTEKVSRNFAKGYYKSK